MPLEDLALKAAAAAVTLHTAEATAESRSVLETAAQRMFAEQSWDVLQALHHGPLNESSAEEDRDRRVEAILAGLWAALLARSGLDADLFSSGLRAAIIANLARSGLAQWGIHASLGSIFAEQWIIAHGAELVRGINLWTQTGLRAILLRAIEGGASIEQVAQQIMAHYAEMAAYRAETIALTEASYAWNFAELEQARLMEAAGYAMLKENVLSPTHPAYDICDEVAAEGGIPLEQAFSTGHMSAPLHPRCQCTTVTYPNPDVVQPWGTGVDGQTPDFSASNNPLA